MLWIVSTVGKPATRAAWQGAAARHRVNSHIFNGTVRLTRRPIPASEEKVAEFENELRPLVEQGVVQIHKGSPDGPLFAFGEVVKKDDAPKVPATVEDDQAKDEVQEPEPVEAVEDEPEEEEEAVMPEPPKPLDRMNKSELVEYALEVADAGFLDADREALEDLTKAEIKELVS